MSTAARPGLTRRQQEVLDFIRDYRHEYWFSPSVRDIQSALGIASPNGVMCHLKALEKKGYIWHGPGLCRTITIVGEGLSPERTILGMLALMAEPLPSSPPDGSSHVIYLGEDLFVDLRRLAGEDPG